MREPILFCFCGPGASGKSTICKQLVESDPKVLLSISTTTRAPRGSETDGKEYYFVTADEFEARLKADLFIEHATFNGKLYGTERANIERARAAGADLLLDIDVQGAAQLKTLFPKQTVTVCVFPPSFDLLRERFEKRGTEDAAKISARLEIAKQEIAVLRSAGFSDYFLVNDHLSSSFDAARAIILVERMRFNRFPKTQLDKIFGS